MLKQYMRIVFDLRFLVLVLAWLVVVVELLNYVEVHGTFDPRDFLSNFYENTRAELVTIAITVLIVEWLRQKYNTQEQKAALIFQLGSPNNAFASEAARILYAKGWLVDGTLKGVFLAKANLQDAKLWNADLQEAELIEANLERANLHRANLQRAKLWEANLAYAELMDANLQNADMRKANLAYAEMWRANLQGTKMEYANLQGTVMRAANLKDSFLLRANLCGVNFTEANLEGTRFVNVEFNEQTVLPDGTKWSSAVDMNRFTDRSHPEFWRPESNNQNAIPVWYLTELENKGVVR